MNNPRQPINEQSLRAKLEPYGDVKAIIPFRGRAWQRHIEFYDSRSCAAAVDAMNGAPYLGGNIEVQFSWDLEQTTSGNEQPPPSAPPKSEFSHMMSVPQVCFALNSAGDLADSGCRASTVGYPKRRRCSSFCRILSLNQLHLSPLRHRRYLSRLNPTSRRCLPS